MRYTMAELVRTGAAPAFSYLILAAEQGRRTVTYKEMAGFLEEQLGFSTIWPTRIGAVVGELQDRIWALEPSAPLINSMVVNVATGYPGWGIDPYLRDHFDWGRIPGTLQRRGLVDQAQEQALNYKQWRHLYRRLTGLELVILEPLAAGAEDDGQGDNPRYGGLPESPEHARLKAFVAANPGCLGLGALGEGVVEARLPSGDEVDVLFEREGGIVAVEVKSRLSNDADLNRGVFQCVKYRAVIEAAARVNGEGATCRAILVTQRKLPARLRAIASELNVGCRIVPPSQVNGRSLSAARRRGPN